MRARRRSVPRLPPADPRRRLLPRRSASRQRPADARSPARADRPRHGRPAVGRAAGAAVPADARHLGRARRRSGVGDHCASARSATTSTRCAMRRDDRRDGRALRADGGQGAERRPRDARGGARGGSSTGCECRRSWRCSARRCSIWTRSAACSIPSFDVNASMRRNATSADAAAHAEERRRRRTCSRRRSRCAISPSGCPAA